jgi:hypothetical protein
MEIYRGNALRFLAELGLLYLEIDFRGDPMLRRPLFLAERGVSLEKVLTLF